MNIVPIRPNGTTNRRQWSTEREFDRRHIRILRSATVIPSFVSLCLRGYALRLTHHQTSRDQAKFVPLDRIPASSSHPALVALVVGNGPRCANAAAQGWPQARGRNTPRWRASPRTRSLRSPRPAKWPYTPLMVVDDGLRRTFIHSFSGQAEARAITAQRRADPHLAARGRERQHRGPHRPGHASHAVRRISAAASTKCNSATAHSRSSRASPRSRRSTPRSKASRGGRRGRSSGTCGSPPAASRAKRSTRCSRRPSNRTTSKAGCKSCGYTSQSERYRDAGHRAGRDLRTSPSGRTCSRTSSELRQLGAKLILKEIQLRAAAGQHQAGPQPALAVPAEGVAGETLQQVRELLAKYAADDTRRKNVLDQLNGQVAKDRRRQRPRAGRGLRQGNRRRSE